MKGTRVGLGVLALAVLISWFSFDTAHAQVGYNVWNGKWFKLNTNFKGYERNLPGPPDWLTANDRVTLFVQIGLYTDPNGSIEGDETFVATFHYYDDNPPNPRWVPLDVTLHRVHGNPLDFLIWAQKDQGDFASGNFTTGIGERFAFAARISGKMDRTGTSLQSASFKSLGGYFVELAPTDPGGRLFQASGITMTGGLVPATFCNSTTNQQYPPCLPPK